jgi:hypothetical protein
LFNPRLLWYEARGLLARSSCTFWMCNAYYCRQSVCVTL